MDDLVRYEDAQTAVLRLHGETHTVGTVLRDALLACPECVFAAYTQTHPSDTFIDLRVQTTPPQEPVHLVQATALRLASRIQEISCCSSPCASSSSAPPPSSSSS